MNVRGNLFRGFGLYIGDSYLGIIHITSVIKQVLSELGCGYFLFGWQTVKQDIYEWY